MHSLCPNSCAFIQIWSQIQQGLISLSQSPADFYWPANREVALLGPTRPQGRTELRLPRAATLWPQKDTALEECQHQGWQNELRAECWTLMLSLSCWLQSAWNHPANMWNKSLLLSQLEFILLLHYSRSFLNDSTVHLIKPTPPNHVSWHCLILSHFILEDKYYFIVMLHVALCRF